MVVGFVVVFVTVLVTIFVRGWKREEPPIATGDERETGGVR